MKKQILMGGLLAGLLISGSCKKTTESVVDCFSESVKVSLHVNVNSGNAKQIATEVKYWGHRTISSVKWEYGDGTIVTTTGLTSNHIYTAAGNYTVKARVTITEGKSSCETDPTKSVSIL